MMNLTTRPSLIKDGENAVVLLVTILLYKQGLLLQPKCLVQHRAVTAGARCYTFTWTCQLLETGDGSIQAEVNMQLGSASAKKAAALVPMWWGM
jgi:hypothetical protein